MELIGSDYDFLMITFKPRLKKSKGPNQIQITYDYKWPMDPEIL